MLRPKSQGVLKGCGPNQDQEGHGRQAWRLPKTLGDSKIPGEPDTLLVTGLLIIPDTEEVTGSIPVPPTAGQRQVGPNQADLATL
jgi:hypothetical protein